ncbi:MAG: FKBP-type peptidyl-prolyl cis-trans isomerase [Phycisphaerales bacterium]|nr:FKBP-type peptidyl-prolyl cis-trans isomerase [Phycisphaerales bacterium]
MPRGDAILSILTLGAAVASCAPGPEPGPARGDPQTLIHPSGLVVEDLRVGEGPLCEPGSTVTVHYTGELLDGAVFDSTRPVRDHPGRGRSMTFDLNDMIAGWREGVPGMRVGGERRLVIPSHLAYGETGRPPRIPPNAILVFTIELLDAQAPDEAPAP